MKKIIKKINFRKGSESVSYAIVSVFICFLIIEICGYLQLFRGIHEITNALDVAGRSASIAESKDDADGLAQAVAESSISNDNISNITVSVEYATADDVWVSGLLLKVTITADVETFSIISNPLSSEPHIKTVSKTMIYTVENNDVSDEDLYLLADLIWHEAGISGRVGMMAVGTCILNRVESNVYPDTLREVIYQPNQMYYCYNARTRSEFDHWLIDTSLIPEDAVNTARDLLSGDRNAELTEININKPHPCYSWYAANSISARSRIVLGIYGINIGGNWFHWLW